MFPENGHNRIIHHCCRSRLQWQRRQPWQEKRQKARSKSLEILTIKQEIDWFSLKFELNMKVTSITPNGIQCDRWFSRNLGINKNWETRTGVNCYRIWKAHLWHKISAARSCSSIFPWKPPAFPSLSFQHQQWPFPGPFSKPCGARLVFHI